MLLIVAGVVLMGMAAGFAFATYKVRRIRRIVAAAGYGQREASHRGGEASTRTPSDGPALAAAGALFRRRLVFCGVMALAGALLIVAGSVWPG